MFLGSEAMGLEWLPVGRGKAYYCPLVSFQFPFSTPFVGYMKLDWGPPTVIENSMFTEVQKESAGVNQSTEGAGDLTSYQPHWVSQIWPSEPLFLVTQDLMSSEDGVPVYLSARGQSCPLNGFGSLELQTVPFLASPPQLCQLMTGCCWQAWDLS